MDMDKHHAISKAIVPAFFGEAGVAILLKPISKLKNRSDRTFLRTGIKILDTYTRIFWLIKPIDRATAMPSIPDTGVFLPV